MAYCMKGISRLFSSIVFIALTGLILQPSISAQDEQASAGAEVNLEEGEQLFKINCATCHNKNMQDPMTGPALAGSEERWEEYPREDLYSWIRNSQKMIAEGHPRAQELWDEWKPTVMNNFPSLTDQEIENILAYIKAVEQGEYGAAAQADQQTAGTDQEVEEEDNTWLYAILFFVLAVLALILARITTALRNIAVARETGETPPTTTVWDVLTSRNLIAFVLFAIIILGGYTTVNNAIAFGRQQGYAPEQPIKFSHKTHAGLHQIDCKFCHSGARRSKQSVIPSANTCMNCHRAIKNGSKYGTAELTKIYASIGYNPSQDVYMEGYENFSRDTIEQIYKKWISDNLKRKEGVETLDTRGERMVENQWKGIVESLTSEDKSGIPGPIEWKRIHNLPDHVFFSHAQHVTAGQLDCQQCHGKVEEMDIVRQWSTLSMGWCVNCHRETEVQGFDNNEYYMKNYAKYHEALSTGEMEKVTVEDIGGIECQKCHY